MFVPAIDTGEHLTATNTTDVGTKKTRNLAKLRGYEADTKGTQSEGTLLQTGICKAGLQLENLNRTYDSVMMFLSHCVFRRRLH